MAGASVTFEAALDGVVAVSACPQGVVGINRTALSPLAIEVLPAGDARCRDPMTPDVGRSGRHARRRWPTTCS
jgi:hypothetical protein